MSTRKSSLSNSDYIRNNYFKIIETKMILSISFESISIEYLRQVVGWRTFITVTYNSMVSNQYGLNK